MSDSPIHSAPVSASEKPILDKLLLVRDKLLLLKQDKSSYVKSTDVLPLYEEVNELVHQLNDVRGPDHLVQNRMDSVLDDCLQLISLFFMTIGRNNEAPALYSMTSNIMRLCDHLKEAKFYLPRDIEAIQNSLSNMKRMIDQSENKQPYLTTRIQYRIEICQKLINDLTDLLSALSPETRPTWEKLVSILRAVAALNTRSKFSMKDLNELRDQLLALQNTMVDGQLPDERGNVNPQGQELIVPLLKRCLMFCELVEERQGQVDPRFQEQYEKLIEIRNQLDRLTMTQAWSMRETDLFSWQRKLDRIDDTRREGNFWDSEGHSADLFTQRTLLYLIRKGYALIYQLLVASEPVSEALLPIYNQLLTLRRCLLEVKKSGGCASPRELYPYSMKLNSIDNMRVDGKFVVGKDVPEGQGKLNDILAECYDIAYELRTSADEGYHDA